MVGETLLGNPWCVPILHRLITELIHRLNEHRVLTVFLRVLSQIILLPSHYEYLDICREHPETVIAIQTHIRHFVEF